MNILYLDFDGTVIPDKDENGKPYYLQDQHVQKAPLIMDLNKLNEFKKKYMILMSFIF